MKKHILRVLTLVLILSVIGSVSAPALAATGNGPDLPQASAYITGVYASLTGGNGSITVNFSITATHQMSSLGATSILIYDEDNNRVKTYTYTSTSGMIGYNRTFYQSSITWSSATNGEKYYAVVFYKASNSSGYDTTSYTTDFVYANPPSSP